MNRYYKLLESAQYYNRQLLIREIEWVNRHNQTLKSDTYHNTRHLIKASHLTWMLAVNSGLNPFNILGNKNPVYLLSKTMLVHDFCYLGDKDDQKNIDHSLAKLRELGFFEIFGDEEEVIEFIQYTHYSFDDPNPQPPKDPTAAKYFNVLRDADQLYGTVFFDKTVYDGLYADFGVRFGFTPEGFLMRNMEYIKNIKMLTPFGNALKQAFLPDALYDHQILIDKLTK